jgi:exodeoxyribonuclease V
MLINQIISKLKDAIGFEPTSSQEKLIKNLANFTIEGRGEKVLLVKGYAGTGKTTTLSAYVKVLKELGYKVVLLAPTGRAAKVFSSYAKSKAYTIHKKIYRQKSSKDGFGKFVLDNNLHTRTFFIVDEASMISNQGMEGNAFGSGYLLNDLFSYVNNNNNCNLILVGDKAQLPPVGLSISPALDGSELQVLSSNVIENELTEVVRQEVDSGILKNATDLRLRIDEGHALLPIINSKLYKDFVHLHGSELIEAISDSYSRVGIEETLIICRSNKRANKYNQGIRNQILWREEEIAAGDLLMVVKNNYYWLNEYEEADFIANGDIVEVIKVHGYKELYGFKFAICTINLVDYGIELEVKLLLDALHSEAASLTQEENKRLYYNVLEDYIDLKPKRKQYEAVKNNEFFNALQVKYAYAVTCHKAQGGQWKEVYIDAGYLVEDMIDIDYLRWLYTAITRATNKVYLVNFPKDFVKFQ